MNSRPRPARAAFWVPAIVGALASGLLIAPPATARDLVGPAGAGGERACVDRDLVFRPGLGTRPVTPPTEAPTLPEPLALPEGSTVPEASTAPEPGALRGPVVAGLTLSSAPALAGQAAPPTPADPPLPHSAGPAPLVELKSETKEQHPAAVAELTRERLGVTLLNSPEIEVAVTCMQGQWTATLVKATQLTPQASHLPSHITEVTEKLVKDTADDKRQSRVKRCATLAHMWWNLFDLARRDPRKEKFDGKFALNYHVRAAIDAHEDVHYKQWKAAIQVPFRTLRTDLAKISTGTEQQAVDLMTTAVGTFMKAHLSVAKKTAAHEAYKDFQKAEQAVLTHTGAFVMLESNRIGCARLPF